MAVKYKPPVSKTRYQGNVPVQYRQPAPQPKGRQSGITAQTQAAVAKLTKLFTPNRAGTSWVTPQLQAQAQAVYANSRPGANYKTSINPAGASGFIQPDRYKGAIPQGKSPFAPTPSTAPAPAQRVPQYSIPVQYRDRIHEGVRGSTIGGLYQASRGQQAYTNRMSGLAADYYSKPYEPQAQSYDWEDYANAGAGGGYGGYGGYGGGGYGGWGGGGGGGYADTPYLPSWYMELGTWRI
jgi:hypothetical protein